MSTILHTEPIAELLGVTPIAHVTDEEIWQQLVSPTVKALMGEVKVKEPARLMDTKDGLFKGDAVSNLNHHDIKGPDSRERVRFPYLHTTWRTVNGVVVFKRDGLKFEIFCWFGDVDREKGELIFKAALRDRRYDGTLRANDCALLDYTYNDPRYHQRLSQDFSSVEASIYGFMPGSRIVDATGDTEFDAFVANPFRFIDDPDKFLSLFQRAFNSKRAPGQFSSTIPDVSQFTLRGFEQLAKKSGYDLVEVSASHYHVAKWAMSGGYTMPDADHSRIMAQLAVGLEAIRAKGNPLTRPQQSWVCVLQSLRPVEKIPAQFYMGADDLFWPQDNISDQCLWLFKPISARAKDFNPKVTYRPDGEDPSQAPARRKALQAAAKRRK